MNKSLWSIYMLLVSFCLFISLNVMLIAYSPLTIDLMVKKAPIQELSVIDRERISKQLSLSLQKGHSIQVLLENGNNAFSQKEILHMKDVYQILNSNRWISILITLLFILGIKIAPSWNIKKLQNTGKQLIILFLVSLAMVLLFFPSLFWIFHQFSFSNEYWLLDPQQHLLIQIFPAAFFQWAVARIFLLSVLMAYIFWYLIPRSFAGRKK